jgi:VWFA-related protein
VRRIGLLTAALFAVTLHASPQTSQVQPPPQPPPVFRAGTNLVQVDAIVTDPDGHPLVELTAADFELQDDGKPMTIDRVRVLGAEDYSGDSTPAPIRTHDDEEREASRDDVRVYAIMLDDYHVQRMEELRVIEPLLAFVRQLPPTDLVAVYYPLDSVTDVAFTRDREAVFKAIRAFYGRKGDYQPKRPVEEEHLRFSPGQRETIRRQIVTSALEGLALHLGSIKIGRKTIIFVSDGFTQPVEDVRDLFQAANRTNTAIYPLDPRGLTMANGRTTSGMIMNGLMSDRDAMETLAAETGGRAIVQKNDLSAALGQVIRDSRAYYLIAYESPHPDDGKFHKVSVRVKRRGASVFARTGYWAFKRSENTAMVPSALPPVSPAVQAAVDRLADSLRPDADEPTERPRRMMMPAAAAPAAAPLLAPPTIAVAHGKAVGEPVKRREFSRTDTLVVRSETKRTPVVSGRLLNRRGDPLTDLPLTPGTDMPELRLPLGSLGAGDYVIELTAKAGDETVQQYVAFRVVR